jgi:membrane protease YdiL (CAAX protease family)
MSRVARQPTPEGLEPDPGYLHWSTRPLHALAFLLPLIVAYEIGAAQFLAGDNQASIETIRAHRLLTDAFGIFGVTGLYLPAALLVVVLAIWHFLTHDPFRIRPRVLAGMALESGAWSVPMIVTALLTTAVLSLGQAHAAAAPAQPAPLDALSWPALITVSLGAGIYEELLFRLVAITIIYTILADLIAVPKRWAWGGAIVASAIAFALYHDEAWGDAGQVLWRDAVYFTIAGAAFGGIFAWRGFAIVVAVHALMDIALLTIQRAV